MLLRRGIWLELDGAGMGGNASLNVSGGGGGGLVPASLHIDNRDTWWDAADGDFASPGGLFQFSVQDYTVELWVKLTTGTLTASANYIVVSTDDFRSMRIEATSGDVWHRAGGEWVTNPGGALSENVWHHVAGGWDASAGTAYININAGGWETRGTTPQTDPINFFGFRLGDWGAGAGHLCRLAEVRLWDHLRTAQEISDNYDSVISPAAYGLVALYASANANTGVITTVYDEAGSNDCVRQNGTNGVWDTDDVPL